MPAELAVSGIKSDFERVERATDEVRATAEEAKATANRAERSLEDIREALMERQRSEFREELNIFRDVLKNPSRTTLIKALRKALEDGIITSRGVRAPIWETDLHYRFLLDADGEELLVQIETDACDVLSRHFWDISVDPEEFYQQLVLGVRKAGGDLGVGLNDPTQSVQELAEMLTEVTQLRAQELMGYRDTLHGIIERRDGWYFTEEAILPPDNLQYQVAISRLDEMDWEEHLLGKGWHGVSRAFQLARAMYHMPRPDNFPQFD